MPTTDPYENNQDFSMVRHVVAVTENARAELALALDRRDKAVRELRLNYPEVGPTRMGRLINMSESLLRQITRSAFSR